jgi:hypothetical protein
MIEKPKGKSKEHANDGCQQWLRLVGLVIVVPSAVCIAIGILMFACTVLYAVVLTLLPPRITDFCETFITTTTGFRTRVLSQGFNGNTLTYESTRDAGKTWLSLYQYTEDSSRPSIDCEAFQIESDNFHWFTPQNGWNGHVIVTHDAGITWHEWKPSDIEEYPGGFRCGEIEEINFQDESYGGMQLSCGRYEGNEYIAELFSLLTTDGGITWEIAND